MNGYNNTIQKKEALNNTEKKEALSLEDNAEKQENSQKETKLPTGTPQKVKRPFNFKKAFLATLAISLALIVVLSVTLAAVSLKLIDSRGVHRAVYDKSDKVTLAESGEMVPLYNYSLGDIQIPALEGVPKATYGEDNFVKSQNGFMYYLEDGEVCSYVGIDISAYNGDIDWEAVKADGVDFVMLRIGGRGYGESGILYDDEYFAENLKAARAAGLWVGAYFFSQAAAEEEAVEEAEYALSLLDGEKLDYPLAFDWEIIESEVTRIDNVAPETVTACARAFCDTVKEAGYTPAIYTGSSLAYYKYNLAKLSDVDLWYAYYNDSPSLYYNYTMWQYSCTGKVDGIEGDVDLNICFKNYK